jgi:archaellum component FlaG (FlaF/FlaG flagellin family)
MSKLIIGLVAVIVASSCTNKLEELEAQYNNQLIEETEDNSGFNIEVINPEWSIINNQF